MLVRLVLAPWQPSGSVISGWFEGEKRLKVDVECHVRSMATSFAPTGLLRRLQCGRLSGTLP